jgi:hypothetical protein
MFVALFHERTLTGSCGVEILRTIIRMIDVSPAASSRSNKRGATNMIKPFAALKTLYGEIHGCSICVGAPGCAIQADSQRVRRNPVKAALRSDVFLVGQALSQRTQRLSGYPYRSRCPASRTVLHKIRCSVFIS